MEIIYNNKNIQNNEILLPSMTQNIPQYIFNIEPNKLYTLIMYDPDTPVGDYIHWIVTNISNKNISGNTLLSYKGPSPPKNTGLHRYIFFIYEQKQNINNRKVGIIERMTSFVSLLEKLQLTNIEPINIIQFKAENISKLGGKKNKSNKRKRRNSKKINKSRRKYINKNKI
jgi:phosphatidylethanolamine-binding protein (PEBP) family uncharacterized protein